MEPIRYKTKLRVIWLSNGIFDLHLLVDDEARQGATLRRKGGRAVSARGRWQAHPAARLNCRNYSSPRGARRRGQRHGRRSAAAARAGLISRRRGPKASFIEKDGQLAIAKAMCRNRRDYAV